jgi:hypothetical protein
MSTAMPFSPLSRPTNSAPERGDAKSCAACLSGAKFGF